MTDRKPHHIGVTVAAIVIYFVVGYMLVQKFWPNSNVAFFILIVVGVVGGYLIRKRRRDLDQEPRH